MGELRGIRRIRLLKCGARIGKSSHSAKASKVVIERPIFLDENDDMLNITEFAANRRAGVRLRNTSTAAPTPERGCNFGSQRTRAEFK